MLTKRLIDGIKALEPAFAETFDSEKIKAVLALARDRKATYGMRLPAIKSFLVDDGAFKDYSPTGTNPSAFKEEMKTELAFLYFNEGKYKEVSLAGVIDKLPEPQKKFVEAFVKVEAGTVLNENEIKGLLDSLSKKEIDAKALYSLAELNNGAAAVYKLSASHRFRIYNAIGLKGKADEIVSTITENAEKLLFEQLLRNDKKYKEMTPAKQEEARLKLTKAFDACVTGTTDPAVIIEIAEQLKELSDHIAPAVKTKILKQLDLDATAFDALADEAIDNSSAADSAAEAERLRLNDLRMRAKLLRAKIEIKQCEDDPLKAITDYCEPTKLIDEMDSYLSGKSAVDKNYKLEKDMVDTLKALNPDSIKIADTAQRQKYSAIMVRMAKESNDKQYLEKINPDDLTDGNVKADYHELNGNFLEAAKTRTDNPDTPVNEKISLLEKALAAAKNKDEKEKVAEEYLAIGDEPSAVKAVDIYLDTKNFSKIKEILVPSSGTSLISDGQAKAIVEKIPADFASVAIEITLAKKWYKETLKIFDKVATTEIAISSINEGITDTTVNKITEKEFVDIIAKGKRTITGSDADLKTFYDKCVGTPGVAGVAAVPAVLDDPTTFVDEAKPGVPAVPAVPPVPPVIDLALYTDLQKRAIKDSLKQP